MCMSYSYTYITFMVIYYTICYVLFSCTIIVYYFHVLLSCTVHVLCLCTNFIYCIHILYSCTVSCTVHILFSCYTFHITFSFIYCTCSYTFRVLYFVLFIYCIHVLFHVLCTFHILSYFIYCHLVLFIYCIIILTFQIILHSYPFSYIMSDRIISCYRTYHHIAVLCFSNHIISFHMSYSNRLFYVSCLHKP